MKLLTRIRLINWHTFQNTTITCNGTTYFIGVNGAGKSTILDAIQFALVGGQRDVKFNQAAIAGGKRTLTSYGRGELGTEGQRYLRGDCTSVIALEFCNPDNTYFVHGAVIDAYEDGRSPDVLYFIVHNVALNDEWFFKSANAVFDSRAFKRHIEHFALPRQARAQTFSRVEDYRAHLLNRLGQLRETFIAKIVKGLAFTPLTDIRGFVHTYLLDENLVDVKNLQTQLETLRHFEDLAIDVRERIDALNKIDELDQERVANRRRRITNGYVFRRAQTDTHLTELKTKRLELDETKLEISRATLQRDQLSEELKRAQNNLIEAQVALQTDVTAQREKELKDQIARLDSELNDLRARERTLIDGFAAEARDAARLRELLTADSRDIPDSVKTFKVSKTLKVSQPQLQSLILDLESLGRDYASEETLHNERARILRDEGETIENEIRQLRTGDREASYEREAPEAVKLRQLVRAELNLTAEEVFFLCTALQVPNEKWQDAVEGVLGNNRFTLLVPPNRHVEAMRLYRQHRHTEKLHGVGLLDSERILAHTRNAQPESLATEVEAAHPAARAFIDLVLGGYIKCETLEELRPHRTAITPECFVRRNFTDSHLNPRVYQRWFIGDRATPKRIAQLEARLKELADEMVKLNERSLALKERLALSRDKVRKLVELAHGLESVERLAVVAASLESLKGELAALDTRNAKSLRQAVQKYQQEQERAQRELEEVIGKLGALQNRTESLSVQIIPELERRTDEAQRSVETFVAQENADVEDVGKEYDRRRERQPLETILENAERYEREHQNAEMRSRDKLREAKHEYSLKNDFGYDEDEDAERYRREREKFVQSELPRYEADIAKQRKLAEQELVENFIHRLREQIADAKEQLDYLNTTLRDLRFGGERFEFITRPAPTLKQVYEMVMDSQQILGDSLFESEFRQKHQPGWDLLFERLTAKEQEEAAIELRELQDYRNYLEYDIRIHYPNGDRALLSQINAKKSGGETTTPFYVAMAASFAQAYRLNQPKAPDTIRLALFDEAFSKMDTARTASALQFMRETGLQVLLATPPDKSGALLKHVDCVRTVVKKDNSSFVVEIDKREMDVGS